MDKIKVAYVGLRGVPAEYSGIERVVEEVGSRLAKKGHGVTVYCMSGRYINKKEFYRGMALRYIPAIKRKNFEMITYGFLSAVKSALLDYDIVHFHAIGPATMSIIPKLFGKKVVVTVHALDWKRTKWSRFAKLYLKFGEWASIHFPHATSVVSNTLERYYKDKYGKNVFYIPNGIQQYKYVALNSVENKFALEKNKYILFVGRISREKRIDILIKAFKNLETDFKLIIVGGAGLNDSYERKLKKIAAPDKRVVFTGPIYDRFLARIFSNAFLFVLPSELEGLPVVLLEALSFGNAVLVSDIPENLEVIQDDNILCGFTFKCGQAESLESVLFDLIANQDKVQKMKHKSRDLVKRKYNWDDIAEKTENLYKNILNGS